MTTCPFCSAPVEGQDKTCPVCHAVLAETRFSWLALVRNLDMVIASVCLTAMILVVLAQIILRNFFHSGLSYGDELVRHLVLWVVFLGAGVAARENRHIRIDVMARVFPPQIGRYIDAVVALFSTVIGLLLTFAAFSFVRGEYRDGITLTMFNMPVWFAQAIIPAGYLLITVYLGFAGIVTFIHRGKE